MIGDEFDRYIFDFFVPRILHMLKLFGRALERYSSTGVITVITYDMYKKKIKKRKKLMKRRKK